MSDSETSPQPPDPPPSANGNDDSKQAAATAGRETEPPRRGALRALAVVGGCAYAGTLAVVSLPFLASSPEPEGASGTDGNWLRVAKLEALKEGKPERVKLRGDQRDAFTVTKNQTIGSVWLMRNGDTVIALSAECPHLGCAIDLRPGGERFSCPCHASDFTLDGKPDEGPSPRPMDELASRITDDGWVEIDFRRFRQGTTEKVEI